MNAAALEILTSIIRRPWSNGRQN